MALFTTQAAADAIRAGTLSIASGVFYAHLVETIPLPSIANVGGLNLTADSGYLPQELVYAVDTVGSILEFRLTANPVFPKIVTADTFVAIAIAKRIGATPANTDPVLHVSSLRTASNTNELSLPIEITRAGLEVRYPTTRIFRTNPTAFLFLHNPINTANLTTDRNGLLAKLGTNDGTVAFANPINTKVTVLGGTTTWTNLVNLRNGVAGGTGALTTQPASFGMDFGVSSRLIRPEIFYAEVTGIVGSTTFSVYGSNDVLGWSAANIAATDSRWTLLGSVTVTAAGLLTINLSTAMDYIRYLKFERTGGTGAVAITEIEIAGTLASTVNNLA